MYNEGRYYLQAVANCLNLSIHVAESNETFSPVIVVRAVNVTVACTNNYFVHIGETHYVSTTKKKGKRKFSLSNRRKSGQRLLERK